MKYSLKYRIAARKYRLRRLLKSVRLYATTIGGMCKIDKVRRALR